ncbi:D-alanyl-D-alanine carboxypeptidase/D-alanyl-D-alanine endopeptidase [Corynebacterium phoceense]|uniref:D-alanyl-D-alanine carboxypeptidase/D-alanyl-D-alanine endopeptidase n=1 Tax=Corynebacterium phoceense TaxID=1686286 RepID=UPI00211BD4C1|nr:D-alanyl-D-alanine carboxypeptidase/D-alanyl-D-alanine-endopeptidase [Corynebacterium phoceense]MCQ9339963.1 D-alanyl-D-alanine carboxypeptidase/D-alanyl-D-alanine-endopeptidase [Corynebacterium phoceense]MCQ9344970.1 D-alanyl-D-alanine carboxypeptidase/D-alanyl-D-alanine-endopeptidase [Corynebacterium phoceense]
MSTKRVWWWSAAGVVAVAVAATAATGVAVQRTYGDLDHGQAYEAPAPVDPLQPAQPADAPLGDVAGRLTELARDNEALGNFGGQVIDTATGEVVWDQDGGTALLPASSTKVLTLAAATWELGEDDRITTEIVRGDNNAVIIKAAGDVWLTLEQLDAAAAQIKEAMPEVSGVFIDTRAWAGDDQAKGWDPENVDGGFVAPMQPAMVFGGRLGAATGDVPRSHTPALDVANLLAKRLGVTTVGMSEAPDAAAPVATIESEPLSVRAEAAGKDSDNVMAEAIGRELAVARGKEASFAGAAEATLEVLGEHGVDTSQVFLADTSGLSDVNRIPADVLAGIMNQAATEDALRPLLGYLPVAGGDGTLYTRYTDLAGRGYVRAKTGTLTGTSALTGIVPGQSGHVFAFAFLVNDSDVLAARAAQDELASALREF